ncbi:MAG: hypothetical protein RLZZ63_328 [Gemmatimonadota bacterium]
MTPRLYAYYMPQYHPVPENDAWWEPGFTEWTNVTKAKPLFRGHHQPRWPADLGFYDLRVPEVREQQAVLARAAGIEGFVYYHYWFGDGKRLLERPFNEVLASGAPNFPFMLCWANETWKGVWVGASKGRVLIEQRYPGPADYIRHFRDLIPAFSDPRYARIDGKPVFNVYRPQGIPDPIEFSDVFREEAHRTGIGEIYLLAGDLNAGRAPQDYGFDGVVSHNFHRARQNLYRFIFENDASLLRRIERRIAHWLVNPDPTQRTRPLIVDYERFTKLVSQWPDVPYDYFPQVVPDWDNAARAGKQSLILRSSTPELWRRHVEDGIRYASRYTGDRNLLFIKSWNEWAEGNYLEPDRRWGHAYLEALRDAVAGESI